MLTQKETTRISKFLSRILRHQPQELGIALDEAGWTSVAELIQKMKAKGFDIGLANLQHIVAVNNKKRFAFSEDGTKIRASQGHSVEVDLGYRTAVPPPVLYHGTAQKNTESILAQGLVKHSRHHVHLSANKETAFGVGRRHGKPVVLEVAALQMHAEGLRFYLSENGVWLTESVPAAYLTLTSK